MITEPRKAARSLEKVVARMEERYERFAEKDVRNISGYNQMIEQENAKDGGKRPLMSYIVVVVDELADLMMTTGGSVQDQIVRIAQMGRAAGIHMILATQRPSVDVITGLIKANVPSRMAFAVSSGTDSRTILDGNGAEKLLGRGDMLFMPVGQNKPTRIQGRLFLMKTWRMSLNLFLISAALHLTKRWKFRTKKSSRKNGKMTLTNCLMTSLSSLRLKANAASHCFSVISALDTTVRHESSMNSRRGDGRKTRRCQTARGLRQA